MAQAASLPRRDPEARARLDVVARAARPVTAAGERLLPVAGDLGALLPEGGVRRGSVVAVDGPLGGGATTLVLGLAAAATAAGEWAAVLDDGTLGGCAAAETGVALERLAVVRRVPRERWATAVGALLDGFALVAAALPAGLRPGDARRLTARARERGAVLVGVAAGGGWPAEAALRLRAEGSAWRGLAPGGGLLAGRALRVHVEGRGAPPRRAVLARAG